MGQVKDNITEGFTPIMAINRIFGSHGHLVCDCRIFETLLRNAGSTDTLRVSFMEGRDTSQLVDSGFRCGESLYIEASKAVACRKPRRESSGVKCRSPLWAFTEN
jgi:hypothetical protein